LLEARQRRGALAPDATLLHRLRGLRLHGLRLGLRDEALEARDHRRAVLGVDDPAADRDRDCLLPRVPRPLRDRRPGDGHRLADPADPLRVATAAAAHQCHTRSYPPSSLGRSAETTSSVPAMRSDRSTPRALRSSSTSRTRTPLVISLATSSSIR